MGSINCSVFDIFKKGPGPSSSHTIGPMLAARDFLKRISGIKEADCRIKVRFFGSLAFTGPGHGSHRAAAAGLLGEIPESCDIGKMKALFCEPGKSYTFSWGKGSAVFNSSDIYFDTGAADLKHVNTMEFSLFKGGKKLAEERYYSLGGGFISRENEGAGNAGFRPLPHVYSDMCSFRLMADASRLGPADILLENEIALTGKTADEIREKLGDIIEVMCAAVRNGLAAEGVLPGPIGLYRRAGNYLKDANKPGVLNALMLKLNAYSFAAAEENAEGNMVVTAPTSGSSGVLPGIIYLLVNDYGIDAARIREGLLLAALIAFIAKHNASISGAEVGCQGEIGVASSMGAALIASVYGGGMQSVEVAAEIALEHHLGMSCDPVGGYVQIPCIERNAMGAVGAYNSALLALYGRPDKQKIRFDQVLRAMHQTGLRMSSDFKETSRGGLSICDLCP